MTRKKKGKEKTALIVCRDRSNTVLNLADSNHLREALMSRRLGIGRK